MSYTEETIRRFDSFREELQGSLLRQQGAFDQAILKLAAAGLALTVTLATALASQDRHLTNRWSLVLAWAFLAGSIASVLISFIASQIESQRRIKAIDDEDYVSPAGTSLVSVERSKETGNMPGDDTTPSRFPLSSAPAPCGRL